MKLNEVEQRTETFIQGIENGRLYGKVIGGFDFHEFATNSQPNSPLRCRYGVRTTLPEVPGLNVKCFIDILFHYKGSKHEIHMYRGHRIEVVWDDDQHIRTRLSSDGQLEHDINPNRHPIEDLNSFLEAFREVIGYEIHRQGL